MFAGACQTNGRRGKRIPEPPPLEIVISEFKNPAQAKVNGAILMRREYVENSSGPPPIRLTGEVTCRYDYGLLPIKTLIEAFPVNPKFIVAGGACSCSKGQGLAAKPADCKPEVRASEARITVASAPVRVPTNISRTAALPPYCVGALDLPASFCHTV